MKKLLAMLLVLAMVVGLVGCGAKEEAAAPAATEAAPAATEAAPKEESAEKTKIVIWTQLYSSQDSEHIQKTQDRLNEMLADENIEVEVVGQAIDTYSNVLLAAAMAKEGFDICFEYSGEAFDTKVSQDVYLPIDEYLSDDTLENLISPEAGAYNGKQYGLPYRLDAQHMFYNKRIFEEAGTTPEEFLDGFEGFMSAAMKLKDKGYAACAFSNKEGYMNEWYFYQGIGSIYADNNTYTAEYVNGQNYADPAVVEMVSNYKEAYDKGAFYDGQTLDFGSTYTQAFINGEAATCFGGTDWYPTFIEGGIPAEDIGVIPWPSLADGGTSRVYTSPLLYCVASFTEHPAEAVKVLELLVSAEYGADAEYIVANKQWSCPEDVANPALPLVVDLVQNNSMVYPYNYTSSEAYEAIMRDLQLVLAGTLTPEDFCTQIQEIHEDAIGSK